MSVKVKSFWATRGESITKEFNTPSGKVIIGRDIKLGMTVESDSGDRSEDMHMSIIRAINVAFEKEREDWMNDEVMKREVARLETLVPELDENGQPIIRTMQEKKELEKEETKQHTVRRPANGELERESTGNTDVGEF